MHEVKDLKYRIRFFISEFFGNGIVPADRSFPGGHGLQFTCKTDYDSQVVLFRQPQRR